MDMYRRAHTVHIGKEEKGNVTKLAKFHHSKWQKTLDWAWKLPGASKCKVRIEAFATVAQKGKDKNSRKVQLISGINSLKSECIF